MSDSRNPPDYGRIAWPEDIFGSLEVDGQGNFVGDGGYQPSGTYRIVTKEGMYADSISSFFDDVESRLLIASSLGLSDFLMGKLVERLREEGNSGQ